VIFAGIADWADSGEYGVVFMCAQLGVSTAGYYAWRGRAPSARATEDAALTAEIIAAHLALHGNPGVRRMWAHFTAVGHRISAKRVHRLMQAAGLQGRHSKQWKVTTVAGDNPAPAPDLIGRNFTATEANTRWCGDITYIKTWDGWAYLATVIDLHSRALVGWALDTHMRTSLVTEALSMALRRRQPAGGVIFHSDRGTQYTSGIFAEFCAANDIRRSMGRTGTCYDNAVAESFFATFKKELIHTKPWPTLKRLRRETFEWIETYYNTRRRHSSLGYLTPVEYELGFRDINELPA
jgi:putative transposase